MDNAPQPEPEFIVGPLYMGEETLTCDVLLVWPDDEAEAQ